MKPLTVITSAGTIFASPAELVPVMAEDGTFQDRFVTEREALVGRIGRFRGEHVKIGLDEIVSSLYRLVPDYVEARRYCFERAHDGYETTKLRRDIVRALYALDAGLFEEEERGSEALEDRIFRREGADFSQNTLARLKGYVSERLEGMPIAHDRETYANWISGGTIHPDDLEAAVGVAEALHSDELYRRAVEIRRAASQDSKAGNGYFMLTGIHRVASRRLAAPKGEGAGVHRERQQQSQGSRVFPQFPEWYGALVEELRPRIEEGIVDAVIHDIRVADTQVVHSEVRDTAAGPRLARGLMTFSDDGERDEVYGKIRVPKPERRQDSLARSLREMFDAYGGVMGDYVHYLLVSLAMDKIERSGDRNAKLGRADLGTIHVSEILYEGKTLLIPDFEWTYALSPLLDYSFDRHVGLQKALLNLLNSFATDRHKRREYQNSVRKTVPSNSPFYEPLMSVYNASLLFRSLYSSSAQFMGLVTDYMRVAEIDQIRGLVLLPPQERLKRITVTTESIEADKQRVKAVLHYGYPDLQEGIERLKQADREIPRELAIFKTFPYVSELMNTHGGKDYARSERSVLFRVLDAYRIDPGVFMEMLDSAILRAAQAYTDFVGQQGVSGGTQSIPTGTASVVEPQVSPEPSVPGAKGRGSALMPAVARMFDAYGRVVDMYVRRALTSLIDLNFPEKSRVVEIGESDFGLMLINNHGSSLVTSLDSLNPSFSEGRKAPFVCVDQIEHGSNVFCFPTMFNLRFLSQMYGYEPYRMLATYSAWVGMLDGFSKNKEARLEYLRELRRALPQSSPLFPLLETVYQSSELLQSLYTQAQFIDSMTVVMRRADTLTLEHLAMGSSAERDRQLQLIRRRTDILAEHVKAVFRYSQSAHDKQFFSALADLKKADAGLPPEIPFFRSFPQVSGLLACETPADSERRVLFDVLDRCGIDRETYMGLQDYAVLCGANAFGEWTGDQRVEGLAELFERYAPFFEPLAEVQLQGAETPSQETVARQLNPLQRIGGLLGRYLPKVNLHIG